MRKFYVLGVAVLAVLGVSALAGVSSASAATSTWLVNGAIPAGEVKVLSTGSVTLEDMAVNAGATCSEVLNAGTVGPGIQDTISVVELKNCKPENDALEAGICTTIDAVAPVNLPWLTEMMLGKNAAGETVFLDLILNGNGKTGTAGEPGYLVECASSLGLIDDVCTTNLGSADIDNTTEGDVLALFPLEVVSEEEWAKCSLLGGKTGLVISDGDMGSGILIFAEKAGETIAVSEA